MRKIIITNSSKTFVLLRCDALAVSSKYQLLILIFTLICRRWL